MDSLTDLEVTKLCARAMGIPEWATFSVEATATAESEIYDPLHDDAQAMALVKKFQITCVYMMDYKTEEWTCEAFTGSGGRPQSSASDKSFNRAICLCVAQMQARSKP